MGYSPQFCANLSCIFHSCPNGIFHKKGFYKIKRTQQVVRRFQCQSCSKTFSSRSFRLDYKHKKMDLNSRLAKLLIEGNSLRGCSRILQLTYKNTYNKFLWLTRLAKSHKQKLWFNAVEVQFDEMETIHHTKCKPLSIGIAVNEGYQILALQVAEMPAKGRLSDVSVRKYGPRNDDREEMIRGLLQGVSSRLNTQPILIKSDAKSSYKKHVKEVFPGVNYETYSRAEKERTRDRLHETKQKKIFDPIFALNQRCAVLRSQIKRLTRRSWCTTKLPENLQGHLDLFIMMQFGYPI